MATDFKEDKIKIAQTTKGIWYCSEIEIHSDKIGDSIEKANEAMKRVNKMLAMRNRYLQPPHNLKKTNKNAKIKRK